MAAFIESFGKSFILPFDCLIGWFGMPGIKLRLFNRVSGMIVIKTDYREPEGVRYIRGTGMSRRTTLGIEFFLKVLVVGEIIGTNLPDSPH